MVFKQIFIFINTVPWCSIFFPTLDEHERSGLIAGNLTVRAGRNRQRGSLLRQIWNRLWALWKNANRCIRPCRDQRVLDCVGHIVNGLEVGSPELIVGEPAGFDQYAGLQLDQCLDLYLPLIGPGVAGSHDHFEKFSGGIPALENSLNRICRVRIFRRKIVAMDRPGSIRIGTVL